MPVAFPGWFTGELDWGVTSLKQEASPNGFNDPSSKRQTSLNQPYEQQTKQN